MKFSDIFDPSTRLGRIPEEVYGFSISLACLLATMALLAWLG